MTRPEFQVHTYAAGRRRKPTPTPAPETAHVRVDPRVWQAALDLAGGDVSRLTVVSPTEVTVHNSPDRRRRVIGSTHEREAMA